MKFIEKDNPWEEAYLKQGYEAAVGRLFRGLIHNLNGATQAVSMQFELTAMMLSQAAELVEKLQGGLSGDEAGGAILNLREIIERRTQALHEVQDKIRMSQQIMKRAALLPGFGEESYTLNSAILTEIEFLAADPFFKHKVKKELHLQEDLPALRNAPVELHQVLFTVLVNAVESMNDCCENPVLKVETSLSGDMVHIAVQDCGPGINPAEQSQIFKPFFTTKEDHLGLGLYLSRRLLRENGGEISFESRPGATRFLVSVPIDKM